MADYMIICDQKYGVFCLDLGLVAYEVATPFRNIDIIKCT